MLNNCLSLEDVRSSRKGKQSLNFFSRSSLRRSWKKNFGSQKITQESSESKLKGTKAKSTSAKSTSSMSSHVLKEQPRDENQPIFSYRRNSASIRDSSGMVVLPSKFPNSFMPNANRKVSASSLESPSLVCTPKDNDSVFVFPEEHTKKKNASSRSPAMTQRPDALPPYAKSSKYSSSNKSLENFFLKTSVDSGDTTPETPPPNFKPPSPRHAARALSQSSPGLSQSFPKGNSNIFFSSVPSVERGRKVLPLPKLQVSTVAVYNDAKTRSSKSTPTSPRSPARISDSSSSVDNITAMNPLVAARLSLRKYNHANQQNEVSKETFKENCAKTEETLNQWVQNNVSYFSSLLGQKKL